MHSTKRTWKLALAAAGTAAVVLTSGTPALAASGSSWISYSGASVNNARVPAARVTLTTLSPSQFDTLVYSIGGTTLNVPAPASLSASGDWTASATVDLSGYAGRVSLTAALARGKTTSKVAKTLRVVDPGTVPGATGTTGATAKRPARAVRDQGPSGFPGPLNTGVPGNRTAPLTVLGGDLTITTDGAVYDGVQINGCVVVKANDVTIRNSRIDCHRKGRAVAVQVGDGKRNFLLEDSELDGSGAEVAVGWGNYTLRRVNVHGTADGPRLGWGTTVVDSWIHDMTRTEGFHSDAMQSTSGTGILVKHNTLDPTGTGSDFLNSAIMLGSETGSQTLKDVTIEDNYLGGGTYSVNVRCDVTASNVVIRNNTFADNAKFGPIVAPAGKVTVTGNVMGWTGATITPDAC